MTISDKNSVGAAIARAQSELELAVNELDKMPAGGESVAFSAHALSNYLTVISGVVQLLSESLANYPDPQIAKWLGGLSHATDLMQHSLHQILTSSSAGESELRILKWDFCTLVKRACAYYQRVADKKGIKITFSSDRTLQEIWTDPVVVAAVLDNLLSNAVKFSPPGKEIQLRLWREENSALCSIADQGPGLSDEELSKLFTYGGRLSPSPTAGEASHGYGLAVAKSLVQKLGGELWCESQKGKGACFYFRLPLTARETESV